MPIQNPWSDDCAERAPVHPPPHRAPTSGTIDFGGPEHPQERDPRATSPTPVRAPRASEAWDWPGYPGETHPSHTSGRCTSSVPHGTPRLPGSTPPARARSATTSQGAARTPPTRPLRRHHASPRSQSRGCPALVWPNPYGIIRKAIRNNSESSDPSASPARVLPIPSQAVATWDRPARATAIATTDMSVPSPPVWWQGIDAPPPAQWAYVFEELTGDDSADAWALGAAIFIAQTRRRLHHGPTFSELFTHLLPDCSGLPAAFPPALDFAQRRRAISGFRAHATIEWRRRGMISWDRDEMRSLRVGRRFRERSKEWQRETRASRFEKLAPGVERNHEGEPRGRV